MFYEVAVKTEARQQLVELTATVQELITKAKVEAGLCVVFCPHTTAAVTLNSRMDPATREDLRHEIDRLVPTRTDFVHIFDTPSDAAGHIKASLIGGQCTLIIDQGVLKLGSSQGLFFWEFDGPRSRKVYVKILEG